MGFTFTVRLLTLWWLFARFTYPAMLSMEPVEPRGGQRVPDTTADPVWEAIVEVVLPLGPVYERRSRYGDKPALFVTPHREIAHREAPGVVDVRVTREIWRRIAAVYGDDDRIRPRDRSDWVELHLTTDDIDAMRDLLTEAVRANLT